MYCIKCGAEVSETYCPICGTKIREGAVNNQTVKNNSYRLIKPIISKILSMIMILQVITGILVIASPLLRVVPVSLEDDFCNMVMPWIADDIPGMLGRAVGVIILTTIAMILIVIKNNIAIIATLILAIVSRVLQSGCVSAVKDAVKSMQWQYSGHYGNPKLGIGCNIMTVCGIIWLIAVIIYCVVHIMLNIYETVNPDIR